MFKLQNIKSSKITFKYYMGKVRYRKMRDAYNDNMLRK